MSRYYGITMAECPGWMEAEGVYILRDLSLPSVLTGIFFPSLATVIFFLFYGEVFLVCDLALM